MPAARAVHYFTAGSGEPLLLLHGYAQSAHMWESSIPELAKRFTVIAPDLPGFGGSEIPADGLDTVTAAERMHAFVRSLGVTGARVVGHDIGLMVAYAYAAKYPAEVTKLVVMDAFLPGIGDWTAIYHDPNNWHFFFHGTTAEALVAGRERIYFEHYWNDFAANPKRSVSEADRRLYTESFARPGRMRAGWGYFAAFPDTARVHAELGRTRLSMPVLVLAGERAAGHRLGVQMRLVADEVTEVVFSNTGHWLLDEAHDPTLAALVRFL
jgi:pimeloyl-ACP methyl ester carboxylesterase